MSVRRALLSVVDGDDRASAGGGPLGSRVGHGDDLTRHPTHIARSTYLDKHTKLVYCKLQRAPGQAGAGGARCPGHAEIDQDELLDNRWRLCLPVTLRRATGAAAGAWSGPMLQRGSVRRSSRSKALVPVLALALVAAACGDDDDDDAGDATDGGGAGDVRRRDGHDRGERNDVRRDRDHRRPPRATPATTTAAARPAAGRSRPAVTAAPTSGRSRSA